MTKQESFHLACRLASLSIFRGVLQKKPLQLLLPLLRGVDDPYELSSLWGEFVYSLAPYQYDFSAFLVKAICEDENIWTEHASARRELPPELMRRALDELNLFSELTELTGLPCGRDQLPANVLPEIACPPVRFDQLYNQRMQDIRRAGFGIFATAGMFRVTDDNIVPVEAPDPVALDQFVGYEAQRQKLLDNTRALVEGRPAANALLCGDAGTGKSSTVKACANAFFDQGVRLIELRKDQLFSLGWVMGRIARNPLKFIIFIDDLSFNKNDDAFSMLKAALEGSASARAANAVIYATSNRRHIVKETFSDRSGADDVHRADTMQELLSLSDRFGLTIYYEKPNKQLYLEIVRELAQRHQLDISLEQLDLQAEAFALRRGSRSPRAAEQFVRSLL